MTFTAVSIAEAYRMVGDDSPPSVLLRRHQAHRWRDPSPPARRPLHRPPPLVLGEGTHRCGNRPAQVRLYAAQAEQRARPRLGPPPAMMPHGIEEEYDNTTAFKKLLRARSGVVTAARHSHRPGAYLGLTGDPVEYGIGIAPFRRARSRSTATVPWRYCCTLARRGGKTGNTAPWHDSPGPLCEGQ